MKAFLLRSARAGLAVGLLLLPPTRAVAAAPQIWVIPSLDRVRPDSDAGAASQIDLYAARGEYESFQIVVRAPAGGLTNVNVSTSDLLGPGGQRIAKDNLTLYREHYVWVSNSADYGFNRPEGPGWYPDGLIPFVDPETGEDLAGADLDAVPFDLAAGKNQPLWVDVFVPRAAPAGGYTGTFTVTSDQGEAAVQLDLKVWGFELPLRPSLKSSIGITGDYRAKGEELLRNRLMPRHTELEDEASFITTYGLNCTNVGFWSGADVNTCSMSPAPSVSEFQAAAALHDPTLVLYDYIADEIDRCTGLYVSVKQWARNMHQAGIRNLITMTPVPELYDDGDGTGRSAVDIWVLLPKMYDAAKAEVAYVQAKGDEVWSYNDLNQDDYSPKWLLDFVPINYRIQPGFINQALGLTGILYWKADLWTADPWNDVNGYSASYPGEGMLLYPGDQVGIAGVCPSMRLKWLRDGVEDYEYIQLHRARGSGDWALGLAATIASDWSEWTRDPAALEAARRQLGEAFGRTFYDVPSDHWAFEAVEAAYQNNIVAGYADGSYQPTWDVTRGQMAVFIARSIATPTGEAGLSSYLPPSKPTFWDVPLTYWCYKHVEYLTDQQVVSGYSDGAYRPTAWVTRDQMAVYLARAVADPRGEAGLASYDPPEEPTFEDVPMGHWARNYIEYLFQAEIVAGYSDGLYRPSRRVTRAQMAVFLARAFGLL